MKQIVLFISLCLITASISAHDKAERMIQEEIATIEDLLYLSSSHLDISLDQSVKFAQTAIEKASLLSSDSLKAKSFKACGVASFYTGAFNQAITMYDSALVYFTKTENLRETANIYNNMGIAYSDLQLHMQAIENYLKAETIYTQLNQTRSISNINSNIGTLYFELGAYDQAFIYYNKALHIAQQNQYEKSLLTISNNIGAFFHETGQNDSAMSYYNDSRELALKLSDDLGLADASINIGNIFLEQHNADSALKHFTTANKIYSSFGRNTGRSSLGIARVYNIFGKTNQAFGLLKKASEEADQKNDVELQREVLQEMVLIQEKKGDIPEAYRLLNEFLRLDNEIQARFDSTAISSLQARYQVKQKQLEIEALNIEKAANEALLASQQQISQRNRMLAIISITALIITLSFLIAYLRIFKRYKSANYQLEKRIQLHETTQKDLAKTNAILIEKEEMLRTLINATPDVICFKDGHGRWIQANNAILELFDLHTKNYLHRTDEELIALSPQFKEAFESCMVSDDLCWQKQTMTRTDEPITDAQGTTRIFDTIKVPLVNADGSRRGIIILGREITERKENELKLRDALAKAEESDKLKAAFLTNMSHEIRTPLNAILGFSELLKDEKLPKNQTVTFLSKINENGNALLQLIEDILELSMLEAGKVKIKKEAVEIEAMMQSFVDDCQSLAHRKNKVNLRIIKSTPEKKSYLATDAHRLRQIMHNLIDNALKYTEQGIIEIGFELPRNGQEMMKFYVRDTGVGIDPEKQNLLFKRFAKIEHSNKKVYQGTGLGLNIVQQITHLLGGDIQVKSSLETGTLVEVSLPYEPISQHITEKEIRKIKSGINGKRILIVEDVDASFDLLKVILESSGAQVTRAIDGESAVEICKKNMDFDLVLMDIQLPGINGLEATKAIKKWQPELPVIAQTAFAMIDDKEACFAAGCDGYIAKPIKGQLLLPVLQQVLMNG